MIAPEKRNRRECLPVTLIRSNHVTRSALPLTLGHNPVLDPDALSGMTIRPAGNVARREDARHRSLEKFVDENSVVCCKPRGFRELQVWTDPHAGYDEIGSYVLACGSSDAFPPDGRDFLPEAELHAVLLMHSEYEPAELGAEYALERQGFGGDDRDVEAARS